MLEPKQTGITLLLNFLIPGAGHVYATNGERWGYLAGNIICAFLTPILLVPFLGNLAIWVITLMESSAVTETANRKLLSTEESQVIEKERSREIENSRLRGEELAQSYMKLQTLRNAGVMSDEECVNEKRRLIAKNLNGWTDQQMVDFLGPFAQLVNEGAISENELRSIKSLYAALSKERPSF